MAIITTRTQYRILYLLVTALVFFLPAANSYAYPAEKPPNPGALIIVDFTGTGSGTGSEETPAVYLFYNKTLDHIITACGQRTATVVEDGASRFAFLKQLAEKFKRASNKRWISQVNHQLKVYAFSKGNVTPTMQTVEKARKTALKDHITLLVKLIAKEAARSDEMSMTENTYSLQKKRAQLTIPLNNSMSV